MKAPRRARFRRVLVCCPDRAALRDVVGLLGEASYHVLVAANRRSLKPLIRRYRPDLVVFDCSQPLISSPRELRLGMPDFARPSILVLSHRRSSLSAASILNMGADEYVVKPFMHLPFMATIKRLLDK